MKFLTFSIGLTAFFGLLLFSCSSVPNDIKVVQAFDAKKYMGLWYEIARFDSKFENGLSKVTANYSFNENGTVKVVNKGFNDEKQKWESVTGKAKFVKEENVGMLKVSFFGPFYAGYNVIALDEDYKYALVCGNNKSYMWILSREKSIPEAVKREYVKIAKEYQFETEKLIWVAH
jgi:apolipoprotein D and lipocalin family protein